MRMASGPGGGSTRTNRSLSTLYGDLSGTAPVAPVVNPITSQPIRKTPNPGTYTAPSRPRGANSAPMVAAPAPMPVANETGQYSFDAGGFGAQGAPPQNFGFDQAGGQIDPTVGDEMFASTEDSLARALAQFLASQEREKGLIETNALEQTEGLERQKGIDLKELLENFAGRGTAYSGRYVEDDRELGNAYGRRLTAVQEGKKNQLTSQSERMADFQEDQRLAREQARAESLARRLAQL